MKRCLCICLWLLPVLFGCERALDEEEASMPRVLDFETLAEADGFVVTVAGTEVLRHDAAWTALWDAAWGITAATGVKTPPPAVDFSRKMVIAVFWGLRPSGCSNGVEAIETIVEREGELIVVVGPLPDLGPCDAVVYPVQMVQVDQSDLPVVFEGEVP